MTKKKSAPEIIELTEEELESLFLRVDQNVLTEEDKRLVKGAVQSNVWLRQTLEAGKLTLYKLRRLLFGFRSEKRKETIKEKEKDKEKDSEKGSLPLTTHGDLISNLEREEDSKRKGHGRLGADAYPHAEKVEINHPTLKTGDSCPENCGGRLYKINPGVFIRIVGQNIASVIRYQAEKFRCASCGLVVTTDLPKGVKEDTGKYDFRFKGILAVQKYFAGVPFFRQEHFQAMLGIPIPDATQWDLIEQVANAVYPVIRALEEIAASGEVIHNDDTSVRIVEVIRANKRDPTRKRRGMFTTTIFARAGPYEIVLYYSGTKHAGENLSEILKKRPTHLPPIIHMSDALAANLTEEFKNLIAKCLTHGRRQFTDIEIFFPEECAHVINEIGKVYFYDEMTKKEGLSAEKRLAFHQEHSGPVMKELKKWLDEQIENDLVEPNGGLGKAIQYLRRHWEGMTLFLREAGAPLDNNVCEQMIKIAIRLRKNSLLHKTCHGAIVASILMSLIQTCRLAKVNPVDYLTACQENKKALFKNPSEWLPWNYQEALIQNLQEMTA
jgi:hypothetical protein